MYAAAPCRPCTRAISCLLLALLARPALAAWPNSTTQPLAITALPGAQLSGSSIPDGAGGFFVVWGDNRTGTFQQYAQRYDAGGNALWTAGGVVLTTGSVLRGFPTAVSDGAGGIVMCWPEQFPPIGVRAQRLNAAGVPQWTAGGIRVATQTQDIFDYRMCADGSGGVYVAWEYNFSSTDHDIYLQHLSSSGSQLYGSIGTIVAGSSENQTQVAVAGDPNGGVWVLFRNTGSLGTDVYVQHLTSGGSPLFPSGGGNPESFVSGDIQSLTAVPDGFGGVIAAFALNPYGDFDVEVMHVYADGSNESTTPSVAGGDQKFPVLAADGNGGAFVFWTDYRADIRGDIYGTHLTSYGGLSSGWGGAGSAIASGANTYQEFAAVTADGQGGAIAAWVEGGSSIKQVVATRLLEDGTRTPGWSYAGNPVMTKPSPNGSIVLSPTGTGGAFCVWNTGSGNELDVLAQRLDAFGEVGSPEPHLVAVKDVPNDQGGAVRVTWDASPLDAGIHTEVQGYQLWRQVPAGTALAALRAGTAQLFGRGQPASARGGVRWLRTTQFASSTIYWEFAGGVPAQKFAGYSLTASTASDSTPGSAPRTKFLVQAVGNYESPGPVEPLTWWDSAPDSGYSVDNLPPSLPLGLTAGWSSASTALHWNANPEPDLAKYNLYRGGSAAFVPSPANRVASPVQSWYDDAGAPPSWYKLSAVDIHGNESAFAVVQTSGTADVGTELPRELAFALMSANPARGGVSMRLDLPQSAFVDVRVFDAAGRSVSTLASRTFAAGRWPLAWRGSEADPARPASGLYFVRLTTGGRTITQRVVLLPDTR